MQAQRFEGVKSRLRGLPQVNEWPQMVELIERAVHHDERSLLELPVTACEAVGGSTEDALPGAAAVFCSLLSIHLVDDMLDVDPRGDYLHLGNGAAANLALAFQAAAHCLIEPPPAAAASAAVRAELHACVGRMALATAFGQHLDSSELATEEDYWRVVGAKTPPLFAMALRIGALLGGASPQVSADMERLGAVLGTFVQVSDDLADALRTPAGADWQRRANNLTILYAMTADHPARQEFLALSAASHDSAALAAAQKILLRCGAVSYSVYRMVGLARQAQEILAGMALADREPMTRLLAAHMRPLEGMLAAVGYREAVAAVAAPA